MEASCKVYVVSSNERLRAALSRLLQRQVGIVHAGAAANVRAIPPVIETDPFDVVISDSLPANSQEVFLWRQLSEQVRILMWTQYSRERDIVRALLAGVSGIIVAPDANAQKLIAAILNVASGASLLPQDALAQLKEIASGVAPSTLDHQERMLLGCIVDGKRNAEIGLQLGLNDRQVSAMIATVLEKLL